MIKNKNDHIKYWHDRAKKEGEMTVGSGGYDQEMFDKKTLEWVDKFTPYWGEHLSGRKLDFGCGIGRFSQSLGMNYIGVDITKSLLDIAKTNNPHYKYELLQNPEKLPFKENWFQSIWTCTVLQHIVVPGMIENIISEFYRVLKLDGKILFYENTAFPNKLMEHIHFRSPDKYIELFGDVGFDCKEIISFNEIGNEKHTLFVAWKRGRI